MYKNVASQYIFIFARDVIADAPKTGDSANITINITADNDALAASSNSVSELDATNAKGIYKLALTQSETNNDSIVFTGLSTTVGVEIIPIIVQTQTVMVEANLKQINGEDTDGYNATLKLNKLDIQNQDAGGTALTARGNTTGHGFDARGGNDGHGILAVGYNDKDGMCLNGGATGKDIDATQIDDILADTNEIQGKLPTNKMMGSSDGADDDGTLNTIAGDVAGIDGDAMRGTDSAATEAKQDIIDGNVDDILEDTGTTLPAAIAAQAGQPTLE